LELAAHQSLFFEALQGGVNGTRTVAECAHGSIREDFAQVVTGPRFLVEQSEQRIAKQ
jgi:hypothetical protein